MAGTSPAMTEDNAFALGLGGRGDYKRGQSALLRTINTWIELIMADARRAQLKDQTDISGARALIVEARFYDDIQDALLEGAVAELKAAGVTHDVITVPGALEIPAAIAIALDAAESSGKPYDAAIALGCVIRGDTIHFEIVSMESSRALMDLAVAKRLPLGNGIITVNTDAQAWARARAGELNKGGDAARAALAMLRIKRRLTRI
jgi:6,7-dimethyl-8-ribityllumazine synthase